MVTESLSLFPVPARPEDYILGWLQHTNTQLVFPLRPRTLRVYQAIWRSWCLVLQEQSGLSPDQQVAYFLSKKPSAITRKRYAELLARVYSWAREAGAPVNAWLAALPPPKRLESLPVINRTRPVLKSVVHWKKYRDQALVAWIALTGQKAGDVRFLTLQSIAVRYDLPPELTEWLKQHPAADTQRVLAFPSDLEGVVPLDPATIYRITRRQTKQKGGVAALRNGWICEQLGKASLLEIQQALGHTRADSTKELVIKLKSQLTPT